jgi:cytochrome c oxidase subunit 2
MLWITTAVSAIVAAFLVWAIVRGRNARSVDGAEPTTRDALIIRIVSGAVAVTVLVLVGLLVASVWTGRLVASLGASSAVSIVVTGHQWWWEIEYEDAVPSRHVTTANEIHIPVGRPVVLKVTSRDVIHSFWVPNLAGKRDLIPGYTTAIWLQADRPGTYRGQCAEFCGRQHAHMAFDVVAEAGPDFERWLEDRRRTADSPRTDGAAQGLTVFMASQCVGCHTIRGTAAHGLLGPDLTHLASRRTIGAGTLPNSREHLAGWIVNSQAAKPGNQMPPNVLPAGDLEALLSYLETLR